MKIKISQSTPKPLSVPIFMKDDLGKLAIILFDTEKSLYDAFLINGTIDTTSSGYKLISFKELNQIIRWMDKFNFKILGEGSRIEIDI